MPFATLGNPTTIKLPSGPLIRLTAEQERRVAIKALEKTVLDKMTAGSRLKQSLVDSSISSVGTAVGLAVGGMIAAVVLHRIRRDEGRAPPAPPRRQFWR